MTYVYKCNEEYKGNTLMHALMPETLEGILQGLKKWRSKNPTADLLISSLLLRE